MTEQATAYPLQWPVGRPRCRLRMPGRFNSSRDSVGCEGPSKPVTMDIARSRLSAQLDALGARNPILSTNVELRVDGTPRLRQQVTDPGVAVYFTLGGKPHVIACDSFTDVAQNIAGIAGHIEATRRIERYGCASLKQMFTGFLALPAPIAPDDWRTLLGNPTTLAQAEDRFRARMREAHPDVGGTHAQAAALNAAIAMARKEFRA